MGFQMFVFEHDLLSYEHKKTTDMPKRKHVTQKRARLSGEHHDSSTF